MTSTEKLPRGVGRVPAWWMELTPHYVLDLEEDEKMREQEFQEALYYAQMAAADDARTAAEWKSNWAGRGSGGGSGEGGTGGGLFGGRNFQPGSDGWDPKEWGVEASDPDYQSYLTGAKLPQSYIDAMKEFAGQAGLKYDASQLNHTGKYGSSAGKPAFMPVWAKKKLRSTGQGEAIRQGKYNDSPNKHINKRRVAAEPEPGQQPLPSTPALSAEPEPVPTEPQEEEAPLEEPAVVEIEETEEVQEETPVATPAEPAWTPPKPTPPPAPAPAPSDYTYTPLPAPVPTARVNTQPETTTTKVDAPKYSFNDYYYNAVGPVKLVMPEPKPKPEPKPDPKPEQAPPQKLTPAPEQAPPPTVVADDPNPAADIGEEDDEEVEYEEVVEYVDEIDGEEEEYEEIVEEYEEVYEEEEEPAAAAPGVVPPTTDLSDLQALLAQKQAELARLQGMT